MDDKIKFLNETTLNQDQLVDLLAEQTLPTGRMLFSLFSDLIFILILILSWDSENVGLYITLLVFLIFGLAGILFLIFGKKWLIKISNKSLSNGVIYKYCFYENEFSIDSIINDKTSHLAMQYKGLEKVVIKGDFACLYINSVSMFFVDLKNFGEYKDEVIKMLAPYKKKKSKR
jgi:hypothetical protein